MFLSARISFSFGNSSFQHDYFLFKPSVYLTFLPKSLLNTGTYTSVKLSTAQSVNKYIINDQYHIKKRLFTWKTSKVEAVIAWYVIPCVSVFCSKSVHTIFVVPVVWLLWSPEPKTAIFFVCPHKRAFNTAVIEPYPGLIAVMTVLNKHILFQVVHSHQIRVHRRTVWLSGQPWRACGTCEVAITTKVSPSWLTNVCKMKYTKGMESQ